MLKECVAKQIVYAATARLGARPVESGVSQTLLNNAMQNLQQAGETIDLRRAAPGYCLTKGACDRCPGHRAALQARDIARGATLHQSK